MNFSSIGTGAGLYLLLGWFIAIEALVFILAIVALLVLTWRDSRWEKTRKTLYVDELHKLLESARHDETMQDAVDILSRYPDGVVREFVLEDLPKYETFEESHIVRLYSRLGFKQQDHEAIESGEWTEQVPALRRMFKVVTPSDKSVLVNNVKTSNQYAVQILGMQLLSSLGAVEGLRTILKELRVQNRLMEEPIDSMMSRLDKNELGILLVEWRVIESTRVQRVILIHAAKRQHPDALHYTEVAAYSEDLELRIGACRAGAHLPYRKTAKIMRHLIANDKRWEVRSQAALALGRISIYRALDPLKSALKDPSFWVRQNAAKALGEMGPLGQHELKVVARTSDDAFAVDTARQQLERQGQPG